MNFTSQQLKDMLRRNPNLTVEDYDPHSGKAAVMEQSDAVASHEAPPVRPEGAGRFLVRITSVRKRLIDEDNLCEKFIVDCCRYAGLIPDDDPGRCHIVTTQCKCGKGEAEEVIVEVESV